MRRMMKGKKTGELPLVFGQNKDDKSNYFKCRQRAIFSSVISPAPEMRLISSNFLPMAMAVMAEELFIFRELPGLD